MKKTLLTLSALIITLMGHAQFSNLLRNGGAQDSLKYWTVTKSNGDGWSYAGGGRSGFFATSFGDCSKYQFIDLYAHSSGVFTSAYLDNAPLIRYSEFYRGDNGGGNPADRYFLNIWLYDKDTNVIDSFASGTITTTAEWQQISGSFSNYGKGLRYIKYEHGGRDAEGWAGHYGSRMDHSYISIGNLLMYSTGDNGTTAGWEITQNFGNGWYNRGNSENYYFQTSWGSCTKLQYVDLIVLGYTEEYLDMQPRISCYESFVGFPSQYDDSYTQKIELLDADSNVLYSIDSTYVCTSSWQRKGFDLSRYGKGVRHIRYTHGGIDAEFWNGWYGSMMDNVILTLGEPTAGTASIDLLNMNNIHIFPNPTTEIVNINFSDLNNNDLNYSLTDLNGRVLMKGKLPLNGKLDIHDMNSGYYILTVLNTQAGNKKSFKILKL